MSAICQAALERAVRDVASARGVDEPPPDARADVGLFGRFTPRARRAVALAEDAAREVPHNFVGTEHLLVGVVDEGGNLALRVLHALEVEPADLRAELVASMVPPTPPIEGAVPFTPLAKHALETATKEAQALGHNYIGCEHLLLGVLATSDGLGGRVLRRMGLELRTTRRAVVTTLTGAIHARVESSAPDDALVQVMRRLDAIERRLGG